MFYKRFILATVILKSAKGVPDKTYFSQVWIETLRQQYIGVKFALNCYHINQLTHYYTMRYQRDLGRILGVTFFMMVIRIIDYSWLLLTMVGGISSTISNIIHSHRCVKTNLLKKWNSERIRLRQWITISLKKIPKIYDGLECAAYYQ